jgi:ABC-type transport system involved in multi-copper enzyme maturation permease subunit
VNRTLIVAFLRQRLTSPMRLGLIVLATLFPLGGVAIVGSMSVLSGIAAPLALVFAAGAIGQDVSSGTLQLLLVRPVTRPAYLVNRWLAAVIGALGLTLLMFALGTLVLMLRGTPPAASELMRMSLESTASASGNAAIMVMFSTLVGGLGDVGLYFASLIVLQMLGAVGQFKQWPWLERASTELQGVLAPQLSFAWLLQHTPVSWFAVASWASTITLALAVGIARLNRRELSYAAG